MNIIDTTISFDGCCRQCARLATFLDEVQVQHPDYFCKPVPTFGDSEANFIIVGLAPGMHGANKTGRPFTGDASGDLLFKTLHQFGFSSHSQSISVEDDLVLNNCRITNAVKCLPPGNKPWSAEIATCNKFLASELSQLKVGSIILALGTVAHAAIVKAFGLKLKAYKFSHAAWHTLPNGFKLVDSYHCSRYNTQTKRLTPAMLQQVFSDIHSALNKER